MKISIICPTQDRAEFMPWLAFTFNSLRCPPDVTKELVVVDSSVDPWPVRVALEERIPDTMLLFHHHAAHGCTIAVKRNLGMELATGTHIAWNDDDDGKAPGWLEWAVKILGDRRYLRVKTLVPFVNLLTEPMQVKWMSTIWYSAGLYAVDVARSVRFNEGARTGEDVQWHGYVMASVPAEQTAFVKQEGVGLTLSHDRNIFNTGHYLPRFNHPLTKPALWAAGEWDKTVAEIGALRRRLKCTT